ncbi:alpha-glucuronidase family glycosyl hydrolase [Sphingomonas jejuensis]|uniref:alpha-glucuronidase family glycosyl hydrolase n=1 Tax=Sphingomonas jejuensis TaxID=904715 RepID=UPI003CC9201F
MITRVRRLLIAMAVLLLPAAASAEDGFRLWLRYAPLAEAEAAAIRPALTAIMLPPEPGPVAAVAAAELERGLAGMVGRAPIRTTRLQAGTILMLREGDPRLREAGVDLRGLGDEGFVLRSASVGSVPVTVIGARTEQGLLYGSFGLLRHLGQGRAIDVLDLRSAPKVRLRVLNHWDNLDGHVERGYAGDSLWDWWLLPDWRDPRLTDYARANASIGINGTVLNNVNASAEILTPRYLEKVAAIADMLRPYGIKVYLSARFSAPIEIGGLQSADPVDPAVGRWWAQTANRIYARIPDFGGFLVKANSEGQPGPGDYGRSHAEGANMLARALAPHGGVVMWRAFVYSETDAADRAKQAYAEFQPLDGRFDDNVIVQVKNGAIDFQPREPFHPLFGAMPQTPLMLELQITKEYLGFATHIAYLGTLFEEVLDTDTGHPAGTVADVVAGSGQGDRLTGIAGVANIGDDRDWSGSTFNQANWYAFGRLAWDAALPADEIAREWAAQTFSPRAEAIAPVTDILMMSREAVVDYMTPLGLAHLMATDHHYGPGPWVGDLARPEWNPTYYHRADREGIGFDRSVTGSNAVSQYAPAVARRFGDPATTPDNLLLWFHHLPWDHRLSTGETLWAGLIARYDRGVARVAEMDRLWSRTRPFVDAERHAKTATFLDIQANEARWWRDASVAYFQSVSELPLPPGAAPPAHNLDHYKSLTFPHAPGRGD